MLLERGGASVVHCSLLKLSRTEALPPDWRPDAALITSATTLRLAPDVARALVGVPVVVVGEATAAAARALGLEVAAVGDGGGAEAVALLPPGAAVWHVGAAGTAPALAAALEHRRGRVARWVVYDNVCPSGAGEALALALPVDVVTFASGSAARVFSGVAAIGGARVAVIGPSTAEAARQSGLPVDAIAARPTEESLAAAALSLLSAGPDQRT